MLEIVSRIVLVLLALSLLLAAVRLVRGPTLPDRVVAMDLIGTLAVAVMVESSAAFHEQAFLDAAIVIALIGFVGTIAYARYIERGHE
ncbi:MAG TPA: monovalent cation/H+ antiporter complex subunit F [Vicinamibacterales bacterium]